MTTQCISTKAFHTAALTSILIAACSASALGADFSGKLKGVTITDAQEANKPPVATFTYTVSGNTVSFNAGGSSDLDGTITAYKWDFGDGSVATGATVNHNYLETSKKDITLTVVDNDNAISIFQIALQFKSLLNKSISFQPIKSAVPEGYFVDTGAAFSVERTYGWTPYIGPGIVERNNPLSPGKEYDTAAFVYPNAKWEIIAEPGSYEVTVCVGDVNNPGVYDYNVQVEGNSFIAHEKTNINNRWIERTKTVAVADGKLTLTFLNGSNNHDIAWIKINQLN